MPISTRFRMFWDIIPPVIGRAIPQMERRLSRLGKKDRIQAMASLKGSLHEQQSFACGREPDIRPAFFGQLQIDT